jgi:hypothetical protein
MHINDDMHENMNAMNAMIGDMNDMI